MGRIARSFIKHLAPRASQPDGTRSIYCNACGREIIRQSRPQFTSIAQCLICQLKAQGVLNPEEHVLTQYKLSTDVYGLPVPVETSAVEGILMLYPEDVLEETGTVPSTGGVVGTVKSIFRSFGFKKTKEEVLAEEPVSRTLAKVKRGRGLYGEAGKE